MPLLRCRSTHNDEDELKMMVGIEVWWPDILFKIGFFIFGKQAYCKNVTNVGIGHSIAAKKWTYKDR
jgi:hypothetical protein